MNREVHILSYFSLPTDLANELRMLTEFVSGQDYSATLRNSITGEAVNVSLMTEERYHRQYVSVKGEGAGFLFDTVLGRVVYALSKHSDNLMVDRVH